MPSKSRFVQPLLTFTIILVVLGELYYHCKDLHHNTVVSAGLVTSSLAALTLLFYRPNQNRIKLSRKQHILWTLIGFFPLLCSISISTISLLSTYKTKPSLNFKEYAFNYLLTILWIPFVEEVTYRIGVSRKLQQDSNPIVGAYLSSLVFSLMHTGFTWRSIGELSLSVPLGAFLLAICAEYIFARTERILYCTLFHASCNATGLVFSSLDPRWLQWLDILYLKGH